jgi:hypothetical protein
LQKHTTNEKVGIDMTYAAESASALEATKGTVLLSLGELLLQSVTEGNSVPPGKVRNIVHHGVGRRVAVLKRALDNIFETFPPSLVDLLEMDDLADVQINLHAFVMNLYGFFDSCAWSFVLRHDLDSKIQNTANIGMFKRETRRYLPESIKEFLNTKEMRNWHINYLKNYRDALAHKIPLYIPPSTISPADEERLACIQAEKMESLVSRNMGRYQALQNEQDSMSKPCFTFIHSFDDPASLKHVYLHPQLLTDANVVIEFGRIFFAHWLEVSANPGASDS